MFGNANMNVQALKIAVMGTGYVGISLAVLLAQAHKAVAFDIDPERVRLLNTGLPKVYTRDLFGVDA